MISVKNLSFSFTDGEKVIDNLSFEAGAGERICISAPSGVGKTTLLKLIAGLLHADQGEIYCEGKIGMVFQSDVLFPWATALQNVMNTCDGKTARHWLSAFGLGGDMDKYPREMSGGMCRRTAIARAVGYEPDILLLDEAFKGLDPVLKKEVMDLVSEHFSDRVIIFTTHDEQEERRFSTRTITL